MILRLCLVILRLCLDKSLRDHSATTWTIEKELLSSIHAIKRVDSENQNDLVGGQKIRCRGSCYFEVMYRYKSLTWLNPHCSPFSLQTFTSSPKRQHQNSYNNETHPQFSDTPLYNVLHKKVRSHNLLSSKLQWLFKWKTFPSSLLREQAGLTLKETPKSISFSLVIFPYKISFITLLSLR